MNSCFSTTFGLKSEHEKTAGAIEICISFVDLLRRSGSHLTPQSEKNLTTNCTSESGLYFLLKREPSWAPELGR